MQGFPARSGTIFNKYACPWHLAVACMQMYIVVSCTQGSLCACTMHIDLTSQAAESTVLRVPIARGEVCSMGLFTVVYDMDWQRGQRACTCAQTFT